ncbi:MAG: hypothetical protein IT494_02180 [Gammaproteobacteria bacterium]|nr:hypothetical protein [Gammaproteobacteria bacterium]
MNKMMHIYSVLLAMVVVLSGEAIGQEPSSSRLPQSVVGMIDSIDTEAMILVINERAIEYDEKLVVRDRAGKIVENGFAALHSGIKVRCVESLRERRPFTSEIWLQDKLAQDIEGARR